MRYCVIFDFDLFLYYCFAANHGVMHYATKFFLFSYKCKEMKRKKILIFYGNIIHNNWLCDLNISANNTILAYNWPGNQAFFSNNRAFSDNSIRKSKKKIFLLILKKKNVLFLLNFTLIIPCNRQTFRNLVAF